MSGGTCSTLAIETPTRTESERLQALELRTQHGDLPAIAEINALTKASDGFVRAQAKRLLAYVVVRQAQHSAATLMVDACEEVDYRWPVFLQEAVQRLHGLEHWVALTKLCLRAAGRLSEHGAHVPALVSMQNAVTTDIGHGSRGVNDPSFIRRVVPIYERLAEQTGSAVGIRPAERGRRRSPVGGPLRMAHVVCQIVSGDHAPSRSVETMLKFADRQRFETHLCVTESLSLHEQHAGQLFTTDTSDRRGALRMRRFEEEYKVPVFRPRTRSSFVAAAADLHMQFAERGIDVAFFHGSLATPTEWLLCAWRAAPWQADAAFGVPLHCPAVDYQFFEFEETMEKLAFMCRERGIPYGPKNSGADMSRAEQAVPLTRKELAAPDDHVILGTVGNHLATRMSDRFCHTVAGVMQAHPKTTLLVVGPGNFAAQQAAFGDELCSEANGPPRVRFLGHMDEPARATKAFDIYLNSYPDGGGFVLGDAMAAGRPIVCMVAGSSTYALAGASWVGRENLVEPATDQAYADRLAQLIENTAEREALGRAMRQRYETRLDARRWVTHMTDRIAEIVEKDLAKA